VAADLGFNRVEGADARQGLVRDRRPRCLMQVKATSPQF